VSGQLSFGGLLVIALVAVGAPLVADLIRRAHVPAVVLEIVAGIVVGPSVLGWVRIDAPVDALALIGLAFLLFLAGLEIDFSTLRRDGFRLPLLGFALTLAIGLAAGVGFRAVGWVDDPLFLAVALAATSLGLVVPVLKDAGVAGEPLGRLTGAGATVADFGAVVLLSLVFGESGGGAASKLAALGAFVAVVVIVAVTLGRAGRSVRLDAVLVRLQDTTAEIRVRIAVALLVGFAALAATSGLEIILGAFVAGALLGAIDRDTMSHPLFRRKLDAVGYGFVIPVFFVSSGVRFDLGALTADRSALVRVPVLLLALLAARGLPALLYRRVVGDRGALVAALLQATSLPFIVTATQIGVVIGAIDAVTAAALVSAGLLSVVAFPALALVAVARSRPAPALAPASS
jgi:Kef-type K+ transport system membrane component KefB